MTSEQFFLRQEDLGDRFHGILVFNSPIFILNLFPVTNTIPCFGGFSEILLQRFPCSLPVNM